MKKLVFIISILFLSGHIYCQVDKTNSEVLGIPVIEVEEEVPPAVKESMVVEEEPDDHKVFNLVQQQPEFVGGPTALLKYIDSNLIYPDIAKQNGIEGKVVVRFVVRKDSTITDVNVLRGIQKDCDEEAVRLISKMPKWKPGKNNGKKVNCSYTLPILFRLKE